jgi:hypothetical protein
MFYSRYNRGGVLSNQIIDIENTYSLLEEANELPTGMRGELINSIEANKRFRFKARPQGVIITDSVNNPIFPIKRPIIDTVKPNLGLIHKQYIAEYVKQLRIPILPWHYAIEFSSLGGYIAYNTRPINSVYPFNLKTCRDIIELNNVELINEETKHFFDKDNNEIQEFIHVMIIGNSSLDVYTRGLYETIGRHIISPLSKMYKFPPLMNQSVHALNMGNKFKPGVLDQYARQ